MPAVEGAAVDSEDLRGAAAVPAGAVEHGVDVLLLQPAERPPFFQRAIPRPLTAHVVLLGVWQGELRATGGEDERALHPVAQLSHVARPASECRRARDLPAQGLRERGTFRDNAGTRLPPANIP